MRKFLRIGVPQCQRHPRSDHGASEDEQIQDGHNNRPPYQRILKTIKANATMEKQLQKFISQFQSLQSQMQNNTK